MGFFNFKSRRKAAFRSLSNTGDFDEVLHGAQAVVFKHSPYCGVSAMAYRRMAKLADRRPETPVYLIDVVRHRALSDHIAERLEIWHQSPQAIVLASGRPRWSGSHSHVTAENVESVLDEATQPQ